MKPKRIQRKRVKGWKMPEGAICVSRPTRWGNPWKVGRGATRAEFQECVDSYRKWIAARDSDLSRSGRVTPEGPYSMQIRAYLRGKDLACWCPLDQPCHADVLLEIANAEDPAA